MIEQPAFIVGPSVSYYPVEEEDYTVRLARWRNDPQVSYYLFQGILPSTTEFLREEYERTVRSKNDVVLALVDNQTGTRIGIAGFYDIDWIARHGEHRMIIGEKAYWGKGYGNEIAELTITFGFSRLNLEKVRSGANIENVASIKCYERLSCTREGVLRHHQYRHGKYFDAIMFGILRDEFVITMKRLYGEAWSLEKALLPNRESPSPK